MNISAASTANADAATSSTEPCSTCIWKFLDHINHMQIYREGLFLTNGNAMIIQSGRISMLIDFGFEMDPKEITDLMVA